MSRLSHQKAKDNFLSMVDGVDSAVVLDEIRNCGEDDLYTYFVTKDAFATGTIDEKDINEFISHVYADWYFLHKNTPNRNVQAVKLLSDYQYAPVNLTGDKPFELIKNGQFRDVLPIFFQYTNRLEERYFVCVKTDELYNRTFEGFRFEVRLYLNLPSNQHISFAKEFVDRAYLSEFPSLLKILNNDYRSDNIIIYTDYEYAQKVVDVINDIRKENPTMFEKVGEVSTLLGSIDDYIGFGEQLESRATYFSSRCKALSSMHSVAGRQLLKSGIVGEEKKIILRADGNQFTPTEYLEFLLEKNIIKLVERKIEELEESSSEDEEELDRLYDIRDNVRSGIDVTSEINKLKKSISRNTDYVLDLEKIGIDDFDYVAKLYRIFSSSEDRIFSRHNDTQKRDVVSSKLFTTTETFEGVDTKEFLDTYFKAQLSIVIKDIIESDMTSIKHSRLSPVIVNLKKKSCEKLRSILLSILDDGEEGKEYIDRCVRDYVRILSTGALENVEVFVDGRTVSLDTDANTDIISVLPSLRQEVHNLTLNTEFIDNILADCGINKENLCLNKTTKNIRRERNKEKSHAPQGRFYYNPDGYLSR